MGVTIPIANLEEAFRLLNCFFVGKAEMSFFFPSFLSKAETTPARQSAGLPDTAGTVEEVKV